MKKAVVIGGSGKVGTYLVPLLWEAGYHVINVSRGKGQPYLPHGCWQDVEQCTLDRAQSDFPQRVADMEPDVVVDMICFSREDMEKLTGALAGRVGHYLVCGSVWIHGASDVVPYAEHMCREPLCEYGRQKGLMEDSLARAWATKGFPGTIVHPGHIVGPGHLPINPQGNKDPDVFSALKHGREVLLPNLGMETVHHVHAADVAGVFMAAIHAGGVSFGQGFHAVSTGALTLAGYARAVAGWYGREANLRFLPLDEWKTHIDPAQAAMTEDHIRHSPNASMEKARRLLGFTPRYTSLQAVREALDWMEAHGLVK